MTDKPDEIDEVLEDWFMKSKEQLKAKLLALKSKWEAAAYKKGYIDSGINQLTNGDK